MLALTGTKLSDSLVLKCFNFEFVILHNPRGLGPRQECSRTMVRSPSSDTLSPLTEFPSRQETHRVNISRI